MSRSHTRRTNPSEEEDEEIQLQRLETKRLLHRGSAMLSFQNAAVGQQPNQLQIPFSVFPTNLFATRRSRVHSRERTDSNKSKRRNAVSKAASVSFCAQNNREKMHTTTKHYSRSTSFMFLSHSASSTNTNNHGFRFRHSSCC